VPLKPPILSLSDVDRAVAACRLCDRLVAWRETVASERRAAYRDENYWGRAVPGFGDPDPWLLIVGLAPAAHGANRTGRIFTGDRSGDFLFAGLHAAGLASQPHSTSRSDGLSLHGCRITAVVHCAPPANRPTPSERDACLPFLTREMAASPNLTTILALGGFAWDGVLRALSAPRPWPKFGHGTEATIDGRRLLGCYHPSQQNTFTGRLTPKMLTDVLTRAQGTSA
jgi:uracil-DNA glycosylase